MLKLPQLLQKVLIGKMFELAIVAGIVSTMYNAVSVRSEATMEAVESSELNWTLAAIHTSLHYRVILAQSSDKMSDLLALDGANPVDLLDRPPPGYVGAFDHPDARTFRGGTWYFDRTDKSLIYLLNKGKIFSGGVSKMLKFKIKLSRISTQEAGSQASGPGVYRAELVQLDTM